MVSVSRTIVLQAVDDAEYQRIVGQLEKDAPDPADTNNPDTDVVVEKDDRNFRVTLRPPSEDWEVYPDEKGWEHPDARTERLAGG